MTSSFSKSFRTFSICLIFLSLALINCCAGTAKNKESENASRQLSEAFSDPRQFTPERIIMNLTKTPADSQAVTWRTGSEVSVPQAQIVPATESANFDKEAVTVHAETERVNLDDEKRVYHHSVIFKSLMPDKKYAYRVGDGEHWSEWNQFKTACKTNEPFTFVYFGDPQNDIKSKCSRIFRAAYQKAPDANFWLFVGDLINYGTVDDEWGELFYGFGWISRVTPMMMLPGNHEYPDPRFHKGENLLLHLWRPHFTLPENGPDGLEETAYFIDYQGVRFVMLNGNEKLEEQVQWLDRILSKNPQQWTIAAIHQPLYSTSKWRDNKQLQERFAPVLDKYSVDLVLQGHDHTYCRTYKVRAGARVAGNGIGTVYVISTSGPKTYPVHKRYEHLMEKHGTGRQLFQVISVDKKRLRYESYDALGKLYDDFELEK